MNSQILSTNFYRLCFFVLLSRISKLRRAIKTVNRSLVGTDVVGIDDSIYLYYLFGESYICQTDARLVKDITREPSWANALLSVVQKSSLLVRDKRKRHRPPNSAILSETTRDRKSVV